MSRRSILLIVALIVAALGTTMIVLYVSGIDARAAEGQERVKVLTATEVIDAGETVAKAQAAGKLEKTDVVREDMVEGALTSTASIEDQVSLGTIFPGEQIISSKFGAPGSADTLSIPDDKLAISVELTDPARVAGFVNPGSEVAIFVSADPFLMKPDGSKQELPPYTRLLLPKVQVIGVGTTTVTSKTVTTDEGDKTTEQVPRTILTVAVDQEQAEKVIYGQRNGELSFALLSDKSDVHDNAGVTAADVLPEAFGGSR
jgi:pilus assembly protein CpaB